MTAEERFILIRCFGCVGELVKRNVERTRHVRGSLLSCVGEPLTRNVRRLTIRSLMREISIEGLSPDEILQLRDEEMDQLVLIGQPLVFRAGSSEILGEFKLRDRSLIIELAQINGGGEGVLPLPGSLSRRYAKKRGLIELSGWSTLSIVLSLI